MDSAPRTRRLEEVLLVTT